MPRKRYTRILRAVLTAHTREGDIKIITSLAQLTRTPYSEKFAAQAERLRDMYILRGTPLPREIRRWEEARA